jgi:two-component system chemotaxis response regulator CheB
MMAVQMPNDTTALNAVAVGASAGGVEALSHLVAGLPRDLPYAVLIGLHMPASAPSVLAHILDRNGTLPARPAVDGSALQAGIIYVSVPNRHLLVRDGRVVLSEGPTENGHRPAINALFRSVALAFGRRAVGVLLSGVLDDGLLGLAAIRSRGGTTVAQSPSDALFPTLPQNAIDAGVVDQQVTAAEVGALLEHLADRGFQASEMEPDPWMELENRVATGRRFSADLDTEEPGPPSEFTCPECNCSAALIGNGSYRCQVGHAWTADALLRVPDGKAEGAPSVAVGSLREQAAGRAGRRGDAQRDLVVAGPRRRAGPVGVDSAAVESLFRTRMRF